MWAWPTNLLCAAKPTDLIVTFCTITLFVNLVFITMIMRVECGRASVYRNLRIPVPPECTKIKRRGTGLRNFG